MSLDACLPAELRGPDTTITKIGVGLSGAGVHRVEAEGRAYVLKVAAEGQPLADWRRMLFILRAAADGGLAPRVVHVDESRRAIVSEFIADQSFPRLYRDARTRADALALLGATLRRVHALPVPPDAVPSEPRHLLDTISKQWASRTLPRVALDAVARALKEPPPPAERALVLSHNDANPTNLVLDGERILFLDWDVAAPNDPLYDLAVASLFLRMDEVTCRQLIAAHDDAPPSPLPHVFLYYRWLAGVMLGVGFLALACEVGHDGTAEPATLEAVPPLGEFYSKLQAGVLSLATGEGRWAFGLGLLKEAHALKLTVHITPIPDLHDADDQCIVHDLI
ncbi:MAG: phosphotransferase [Gemmatimonadota bacterium]